MVESLDIDVWERLYASTKVWPRVIIPNCGSHPGVKGWWLGFNAKVDLVDFWVTFVKWHSPSQALVAKHVQYPQRTATLTYNKISTNYFTSRWIASFEPLKFILNWYGVYWVHGFAIETFNIGIREPYKCIITSKILVNEYFSENSLFLLPNFIKANELSLPHHFPWLFPIQ